VPALYEDPTSLQADNCTYIHFEDSLGIVIDVITAFNHLSMEIFGAEITQ
jgi:hypothetical protein